MSIEKLKDYQLCIEQVGVTSHNGFDGVTLLYVIDGQITASYAEHHQQLTCDSSPATALSFSIRERPTHFMENKQMRLSVLS